MPFGTGVRASGNTPNKNSTVVFKRQMRDPNLDLLIAAADMLRPLLPELVFVGGCMTGLLITDEAAAEPRGTFDVDAIAEITSYAQYAEFSDRLRSLGFNEDASEGAPLCRWIRGGTVLDVMPLDEKILGFSNRWYRAAMETSVRKRLRGDLDIRMVTAPYFVATKLEAFKTSCPCLTDAKVSAPKCKPREPTFANMCEARSRNCWQILTSSMHYPGFFFPMRQASHESESFSRDCAILPRSDRRSEANNHRR
jgi:hypothetical protein